ncbi:hypothetical protein, partial [Xanthomonas bromi]
QATQLTDAVAVFKTDHVQATAQRRAATRIAPTAVPPAQKPKLVATAYTPKAVARTVAVASSGSDWTEF